MRSEDTTRQIQDAVSALHGIFEDALVGIYLHGSAAQGRLQPQSDIDLLVLIARPMTQQERIALLAALLSLSGRHPRGTHAPRCLEVMAFDAGGRGIHAYPAQAEMVYGEWLRSAFESGEIPGPTSDPENTLILAQARKEAKSLLGPEIAHLLPEIPIATVRAAMRDGVPALLSGLRGDERNVLLTLARIWRTAEFGDFVSKDAAAAWAIPRMPHQDAMILDYARKAYLGMFVESWADKQDAARSAAEYLCKRAALLP